jgi:hypothetical protein
MIHYTCDLCKRPLDPTRDLRYVVRIEISAAFDPVVNEEEDDRDYLEEIQDMLEHLEHDPNTEISEEVYQELRFDLCPECRKRFCKNPLGKPAAKILDYSGILDFSDHEKN